MHIKRREKMKRTKIKNKKSGFTLLEIIIVIIIVGVLASLALPRLFDTIEMARTTEAQNAMGTVRRAAVNCAKYNEGNTGVALQFNLCDTFAEIGINDPGTEPGAIFGYVITPFAAPNWVITAA